VNVAGKVGEVFIIRPVIYFSCALTVLCFARKTSLMHLTVTQVKRGVQEEPD